MKLSNAHRDRIMARLLESANTKYGIATDELQKKQDKLGLEIYQSRFTKAEHASLKKLGKAGWVPEVHDIRVRFRGMEFRFWYKDHTLPVPVSSLRYTSHKDIAAFELASHDSLGLQIMKLSEEQMKLSEELSTIRAEMDQLLMSCSTDKKLVEAWPEISDVVFDVCKPAPRHLPAISIDKMNEKLGIK